AASHRPRLDSGAVVPAGHHQGRVARRAGAGAAGPEDDGCRRHWTRHAGVTRNSRRPARRHMAFAIDPNSRDALVQRVAIGTLTTRGPVLMLLARTACAVGAQALVAATFALRSSPTPWHDAEPWLPVYGTLIDAGCLA